MGIYKKLLPLMVPAFVVTACGGPTVVLQAEQPKAATSVAAPEVVNLARVVMPQRVFIADYGGKKGASVTVNLLPGNKSFQTKASSNGTLAKVAAGIQSLQVALTTSATQPLSNVHASTWFPLAPAASVTFNNVPPGTYFAVVQAFDGPLVAGPAVSGTNIVKMDNGAAPGSEYAAPDTGARAAVSGSSVTIDSALQLDTLTSLSITMNLEDGIGANIGADVTINDGTDPSTYSAS